MIKRFAIRQLFHLMCVGGVLVLSSNAMASAFQLWEQDGASVGDYHAGRAARADDASTSYYNPAGIIRIKNQQLVIGDVGVLTDIKYRGTVSTNTFQGGAPQKVTAQGGSFSQIPDFHYVAPITDYLGFGLSVAAPFGLKTDYGRTTALRYTATMSQLQVVDLSPALGLSLNKQFSIGAGLDIQRMSAEFNQVGTLGFGTDTDSINKGWDTAWGFHVGGLYQFLPSTRFGVAYNSQVVHHIRGTSKFIGPVANVANELAGLPAGAIVSDEANAHVTLPPFTTLSAYHDLNASWAIMATAIYTQWSVFKNLTLKDVASVAEVGSPFGPIPAPSRNTTVSIPEHYHNTWNVSLGTDYHATDKLTLRSGVGYDQSPSSDRYRNVQVPDKDRYAVALGGHFQATKTLGFDLGWTHLFVFGTTIINPPAQQAGPQITATNGKTKMSADIFGAQFTWNIL